jgi:putative hemolysin
MRLMQAMNIGLVVDSARSEPLPLTGPLVVVANLALGGIVEGLLLGAMVRRIRSDVRLLLNPAAEIPELQEDCLFLWGKMKPGSSVHNAEVVRRASAFLGAGGALVGFPTAWTRSGWVDSRKKRPEDSLITTLAREASATVVCVRLDARGLHVDGFLAGLHPYVAQRAVLRETLKSRNRTFRVTMDTGCSGPEQAQGGNPRQ